MREKNKSSVGNYHFSKFRESISSESVLTLNLFDLRISSIATFETILRTQPIKEPFSEYLSMLVNTFDWNKGGQLYHVPLDQTIYSFINSFINKFIRSHFSSKSCCLYNQVAEVEYVSPLSLKRCVSAWKLGTYNI